MSRFLLVFAVACSHAAPPPPASSEPGPHQAKPPGRIVISDTSIEFLPTIHFLGQTTVVAPEALRTLDSMAETINGNEDIQLVEVTAFGDDGAAEFQQLIGQQRAQVIVDYLVHHGVAAKRLRPKGLAQSPTGTMEPVFSIVWRK